jgi:dCTP deaminase
LLLPDWEIRKLCLEQGMVVPYQEELLNPASLDVTLGSTLLVEVPATPELQLVHIDEYTKEDPLRIAPGQFFLAETVEMFFLPAHVGAQFVLKSSRAREGWDHAEAGWCDPGWHGSRLTMELRNSLSYHPLPVWPGMKIGQMKFCLMHSEPERTYAVTGKYNNNACVTASKG